MGSQRVGHDLVTKHSNPQNSGMFYTFNAFMIKDTNQGQPNEKTHSQGWGGAQMQSLHTLFSWNQNVWFSWDVSAFTSHWALVLRVFIGVSLCRSDWLHHWPCDWTLNPLPSLEEIRPTSLHSKPNSVITKFVSLEGPTSIQNQVLSTNSGVVPRGPLWITKTLLPRV